MVIFHSHVSLPEGNITGDTPWLINPIGSSIPADGLYFLTGIQGFP